MLSAAPSYPGTRYHVPFSGSPTHRKQRNIEVMEPTNRQLTHCRRPHPLTIYRDVATNHNWPATRRFVTLLIAHALTQTPALLLALSAAGYLL